MGNEDAPAMLSALTHDESYHGTVWPCDSRLSVAGPIPQRHLGGPGKDGGWSLITYPNGGRHSGEGPRVVLDLTAEDAHKAAAMLLQGNPHGFTQADVDVVEQAAADLVGEYSPFPGEPRYADLLRLRSLAGRIAAFLPRETPSAS